MARKYDYISKLKSIMYRLDKGHLDADKATDMMISVQQRAHKEYPDASQEINDKCGDYLDKAARMHNNM